MQAGVVGVAEPLRLGPEFLIRAHITDVRVVDALVAPPAHATGRAAVAPWPRVAPVVLIVGHVVLHAVQRPVVLLPLLLRKNLGLDSLELGQDFLILHVDLIRLSHPDLSVEGALPVLWQPEWSAFGIEALRVRPLPGENFVDFLQQVFVSVIDRLGPFLPLQGSFHSGDFRPDPDRPFVINSAGHGRQSVVDVGV